MANIQRIEGKTGPSFKITVTKGRNLDGRQNRRYKTWKPPRRMTELQMEKEVQRVADDFERDIEHGYEPNRKTFAEYAEDVLESKERNGIKHSTLVRYRHMLKRIIPAIGHLKLADIRPNHLNDFYKSLGKPGVSNRGDKAKARGDLYAVIKAQGLSRAKVAKAAGISATSMTAACQGKTIAFTTAEAIARVLEKNVKKLFDIESGTGQLDNNTIRKHHELIRMILSQAEREMLVYYNAAKKSSPPKVTRKEVNYFQKEDVIRIREALEKEPLKWRVMTHLLLITGCRRGELMGLRWSRVDFETHQIKIDTNLLYSSERGIYEDTTKTDTVRFIKLPIETMGLLYEYFFAYHRLRLANGDRWHDTDFLFVRDNGEPMNPDSITQWLGEFSKRHDLPHINPYAFRHTMASILINSGKSIVAVSKRMGHARIGTTLDAYTHIINQADEQASECLADVMLRSEVE